MKTVLMRIIRRNQRYSVVPVTGELGCGFLILEVAPFLHAPEASSGQAKMEQLLIKKYLQPNSLM